MEFTINSSYPSIDHLRERAKDKIPGFAFDYLDGGCNNNVNLELNTSDIRKVKLKPYYLRDFPTIDLSKTIFGKKYSLPCGIAPVGLQGMIWPGAPKILAKAAADYNLPYVLSTVSTEDIETISRINPESWFQLYHPREEDLRNKLIQRCIDVETPVLVILADVPSFGYRPKEIKNGLSIPPKITLNNILQIMTRPEWALRTLYNGQPEFKTLKPYLPKGLSLKHLGLFMNKIFDGRLDEKRIKSIRDMWKGKLVLKGVVTEEDAQKAIEWGLDGIIVSNHGGRQLDSAESSIDSLRTITSKFKDQITIMADSGIRNGVDIANVMASGADFTFMGRTFMYGTAAMGSDGGNQVISILTKELNQVMQQLCCENVNDLHKHIIHPKN
jgi:L-lactate dehydrogenase (cytochrome)